MISNLAQGLVHYFQRGRGRAEPPEEIDAAPAVRLREILPWDAEKPLKSCHGCTGRGGFSPENSHNELESR